MKNCTDIPQSRKLLKIGIPPESADMIYAPNSYCLWVKREFTGRKKDSIPCWSLAALLEMMPPYLFEWERGIDLNIYRNLNGKGWHCSYMSNNIIDMQKDKFRQISNGNTLVEAAYNMIVWLKENKYI